MEFPAFLITTTPPPGLSTCAWGPFSDPVFDRTRRALYHKNRANFLEVNEMAKKLYQITCSPDCGFMVRSHDKAEVKRFGKQHLKMAHKMEMSDAEVEKQVKEVKA
jgi:predicted small metal-binding protein